LLHFSAAAETYLDLASLDDHRYLAATVGVLQHKRQAVVILEHVDIFESDFSAGEILTGSRSIGSKILAKDKDRVAGHQFAPFARLITEILLRKTGKFFTFQGSAN
jgi:hypothetical protein